MMKKTLILLGMLFSSLSLFAGGYETSQKFEPASVSNFNFSLNDENLTITPYNGNEIYIICGTNNQSFIPIVEIENNTLIIKNAENPDNKKVNCSISLMLPENYTADKVFIKTHYGKLVIKKLIANSVTLLPGPENSLENIKANYFEIPGPDEADMNISNLDSKEINLALTAGSINLSMLHIPEKESKISSKYGKLNITLPENEAFTINARSFNSKFLNNFNNSVIDWIREGFIYKHKGGGTAINLQTHTGDITVSF